MKILFNNNFRINNIQKLPKVSFGNNFGVFPFDTFEKRKLKDDEVFFQENFADTVGSNEDAQILERMIKLNFASTVYLRAVGRMEYHSKIARLDYARLENDIFDMFTNETAQELRKLLNKAGIKDMRGAFELFHLFSKLENSKKLDYSAIFSLIELYGKSQNTQDIFDFYELLNEDLTPSILGDVESIDPQLLAESIRIMGFKNENEFFKNFAHLKPKFNNFDELGDKFALYRYVMLTERPKLEALAIAQLSNFDFESNASDVYLKNADIVDYLYDNDQKNFADKLSRIYSYLIEKEQIHPTAKKVLADSNFIDIKTAQGKVELFDFLKSEQITIPELNVLTKSANYSDTDLLDLVINRNEISNSLSTSYDISLQSARRLYMCFPETLNALYNSQDINYFVEPEINLVFIAEDFNLKSDKDFLNFYLSLNYPKSKQTKGKKQQNLKVTQHEIAQFVDLLSFIDEKLIEKYKKDKNYPLKNELLKRKSEFENVNQKIEEQIEAQNARYLCSNAYDLFINYYDILKTTPNIKDFVSKVSKIRQQERIEQEKNDPSFPRLLDCFKNKTMLEKFVVKNNLRFDGKSKNYNATCLRVLSVVLNNKDDEKAKELKEKILDSDFIRNSKGSIVQFVEALGDEELSFIFETVLNEEISSMDEINKIFEPYFDEDKKFDKVLLQLARSGMSLSEFLEKTSLIEQTLETYGIEVKINNKNIENIDFSNLKGNKINPNKLSILAKSCLNPNDDGNFVCGLNNALVGVQKEYNFKRIIREILTGEVGRYGENYSGIIREFNLDKDVIANIDCNYQFSSVTNPLLKEKLKPLEDFINNDSYLPEINGKKPNMCLHAKMRLIDRFILQENKDLFGEETKEELKEILKTVYLEEPKILKARENVIVAYFNHLDYEIKAVFNKDGEMLTIAKNEL